MTVSLILNSPLDRLLVGFASEDDYYEFKGTHSTACSLYLLIFELEVVYVRVDKETSTRKDSIQDLKGNRHDK